jgi:predicted regulator of Ras-like GTPase activity (Roadblock/LC7/MglB family)
VEFSAILGQIRNAAEQLRTGGASEVQIRTEKIVAVARFLTSEYFLALAVQPDANVGRARYLLRVAAPKIAAEL